MKFFLDAHIHSRFSRATSKEITLANLEKYARIKGLNILGTADFTFPLWFKELKENLVEDETGILKSKSGFNFILSTEVSNIYVQDGKQRKIHNLILAPNFDIVDQINAELSKHGRLDYDGRPIFSFTCVELVEMLKNIDKKIEIIPAHCLTPWYGIFGSKSGFDSVKECFGDQSKHIHALETGLSADPSMIHRVSNWSDYTLVSFSDSHSHWPWRIGRECCAFEFKKPTFDGIIKAIKEKDKKKFLFTVEFPPTLGKYNWSGHRKCNIRLSPKQALKLNNICPVCRRKLTVGVEQRVEELADRPEGFVPRDAIPYKNLIPLSELIKTVFKIDTLYSKTVWAEYDKLIKRFGNEFNVLLDASREELEKVTKKQLVDLIMKNREGRIKIIPGYDGVYGELILEEEKYEQFEKQQKSIKIPMQKTLSDFGKGL